MIFLLIIHHDNVVHAITKHVRLATGLMHEASAPAHQIHVKTVGRSHTKLQKPARQKPAGRSLEARRAFAVVLCPPGAMMMILMIFSVVNNLFLNVAKNSGLRTG